MFNLNNDVMKKTYIIPALVVQHIEMQHIIALSLQGGNADSSDALVKGGDDWDIFGEYSDDTDEE